MVVHLGARLRRRRLPRPPRGSRRWWAWIERVEAAPERRAREVRLQHREDRLRRDREQRVAARLEQAGVELGVVGELLGRSERQRVARDGRAQPVEIALATAARRRVARPAPRRSSRASSSSSSVTCRVSVRRSTFAWTNEEMWSTVGSVTKLPPAGPFAVRTSPCAASTRSASRIVARLTPNSRGERGLDRQPLARASFPRDDQLAELVGDLLVRLADPAHGHRRQGASAVGSARVSAGARPSRRQSPNSALPASDVGEDDGGSPRSA